MSKQVLGATALALLIGVSAFSLNTAIAQNGGDARSTDRAQEKKLDDRELTPIRPIRRVGDDNWPTAKDQPAMRETTGQVAQEEKKQEEKKQEEKKKEDTAQTTPAPESKPAAGKDLAKQSAPPDKPQDTAKQPVQPKQETAKQAAPTPDAAKQDTAKSDVTPDKKADPKNTKGFASIRLGTDENGRVAVNEAQQGQIAKAIRKQHVDTVNVKVSVGSVAPANVRLVVVPSDMVDTFPQFRGYSFFATREEVVIVEPSSKKVVALIPASNTATASRPNEERTTRTETRQPETTTPRAAAKPRDATVGRSARSDDVPSKEEILGAPVARGPAGTTVTRTYRNYQYVPDDDDVVVIERRRRPRLFPFW